MRQKYYLYLCAVLVLSALLAACGTPTQAQDGTLAELPTAPPAPTWPPQPTANIPKAPDNAQPAPDEKTLKTDSFDGTLDGWQVLDLQVIAPSEPSTWAIKDGRLEQVVGPDGNLSMTPTSLLTGDKTWNNYTVKADAYSYGNSVMGLIGRANDKGFYALAVRGAQSKGGSQIYIERYDADGEEFTILAKLDTGGWNKSAWYNLGLSFDGDTITASINGETVLEATDATYASGKAGVYAYAEGQLAFDNFSVQSK